MSNLSAMLAGNFPYSRGGPPPRLAQGCPRSRSLGGPASPGFPPASHPNAAAALGTRRLARAAGASRAGDAYHFRHRRHALQNLLDRRFANRTHPFSARRLEDLERRALPPDQTAQALADRHDLKHAVASGISRMPALPADGICRTRRRVSGHADRRAPAQSDRAAEHVARDLRGGARRRDAYGSRSGDREGSAGRDDGVGNGTRHRRVKRQRLERGAGSPTRQPRWGGSPEGSPAKPGRRVSASGGSLEP